MTSPPVACEKEPQQEEYRKLPPYLAFSFSFVFSFSFASHVFLVSLHMHFSPFILRFVTRLPVPRHHREEEC